MSGRPPIPDLTEALADEVMRLGFTHWRVLPASWARPDLDYAMFVRIGDEIETDDYGLRELAERVPGAVLRRVPALLGVIPNLDGHHNAPAPEEFVAHELLKRAGEVN